MSEETMHEGVELFFQFGMDRIDVVFEMGKTWNSYENLLQI